MVLHQNGDAITGVYITSIGHEQVVRTEHTLVGRAVGNVIGFVVGWPAAASLTSWAGRLGADANGSATIHTVWHLARETIAGDPPRPAQPWETFLTYTSVFRKVPDLEGMETAGHGPT